MTLIPLTEEIAIQAAEWRNATPESCRTPILSSTDSQREWYKTLKSFPHRYWALWDKKVIGLTGLVNISWENRSAEISIILDPGCKGKGLGRAAIDLLLDQGFNKMNLDVIYGECYLCNRNLGFWHKMFDEKAKWVRLPDRKYWNGRYWDSDYFSIMRDR